MRLFIAIILLLSGGLAAIATTWFFLQTSEDISELEKTEAVRITQPELSAKSNEAANQPVAEQPAIGISVAEPTNATTIAMVAPGYDPVAWP